MAECACNLKKTSETAGTLGSPFVIKCLSEQCTVVHMGTQRMSPSELDIEISSGTEFGKKLKAIRDRVAAL